MSLILLNKPYGVICQFSPHEKHPSLAQYITENNYYPAGRLDHDSEGLVILTDEGPVQHLLSHPKHKQAKTYWVQVDGELTESALVQLRQGIQLKDGLTKPANAKIIPPPDIWSRNPPVRYRAQIPTSWIELTITEGKNRQVRRMTAAVGFPTLRLIRYSVGELTIDGLAPGEWRKIPTPPQLKQLSHDNGILGTTRNSSRHHRTKRKISAHRRTSR